MSTLGCSKDHLTPLSEYKKIAGIWVPYEIRYNDGSINNGPFTANTIFGGYVESVQLNSDKTYFPLVWHNADEYIIDTGEGGNFQYIADKKKIIFTEGSWDMEFESG